MIFEEKSEYRIRNSELQKCGRAFSMLVNLNQPAALFLHNRQNLFKNTHTYTESHQSALTSAVLTSLFDILRFKFKVIVFRKSFPEKQEIQRQ